MRKLLVLVSVLAVSILAAGCGGSSSSGGGGTTPLAGTIGGTAFSPTDVKALLVGTTTTPCTVQGLTFGAKGLALEITSYANACGDFAATQCAFHANARTVTVFVAKLNPVGPAYTEPTIAAGTYTINSSLSNLGTPDAQGQFTVGYAQAVVTDATCNGGSPTPAPAVSGGTLTLSSVTNPITGHLTVTFQGGGSLSGDFSAPLCSETPDVCALATAGGVCTMPGTCTQ